MNVLALWVCLSMTPPPVELTRQWEETARLRLARAEQPKPFDPPKYQATGDGFEVRLERLVDEGIWVSVPVDAVREQRLRRIGVPAAEDLQALSGEGLIDHRFYRWYPFAPSLGELERALVRGEAVEGRRLALRLGRREGDAALAIIAISYARDSE